MTRFNTSILIGNHHHTQNVRVRSLLCSKWSCMSELSDKKTRVPRQLLALPAVVACGYKRIRIPKSGNSFPALLVAFEADSCSDNHGKQNREANHNNDPSISQVRFAWRSKRDFLLLARKGVNADEKSLPKAAFKKVVDEATVPWRRCEDGTTAAAMVGHDNNNNINNNNPAIPDCLLDESLPNHYSARMKKSLWQLDRFLQSMQAKARDSEERKSAWDFFCRPFDAEDLVSSKQDSDEKPSSGGANASTTTTLRDSSRLGQYFASKENSQKVVECALEKILPLYHRSSNSNTKLIFVEPSCGHGDIVVSLVEALKEKNIPPEAVWIMGYDIDPAAIQTCRERQEFQSSSTTMSTGNDQNKKHKGSCSDYTVLWECSSFFETSRERSIQQFTSLVENNHQDDSRSSPAASKDRELLVCCLGGPPYTTGQGSGSAMKRDLPERFVDHCIHEWKTDIISFLLPARYREEPKKILCDGSLVGTTNPSPQASHWIRETQELEASKFFFQGKTEVTQPSIIKLFYKSEGGKVPGDNDIDEMAKN